MRPVETPSLSATSAMRVAPKPRSITTWQVTSRISLRRSSTLGRLTEVDPTHPMGRSGGTRGDAAPATAVDRAPWGSVEPGAAGHGAVLGDDPQLDERACRGHVAGPRPLRAVLAHAADVDDPAVVGHALEAIGVGGQAVVDVDEHPGRAALRQERLPDGVVPGADHRRGP